MVMAPPAALSVTLDLEDHLSPPAATAPSPAARYRNNTRRILDSFAAHDIRATLFVVGNLLTDSRDLLTAAAAAGHELALHSATHTPLTELSRAELRPALARAKSELEDIAGQPVQGFRAPVFSLTPDCPWVPDLLAELGFTYSSSVLPAANPLFGYPGAPMTPFRWPCGLIELPVPLADLGPLKLPFLGGIYLRYLPLWLVRRCRAQLAPAVMPWMYLHPYDIDAAEPYYRFPGTSALQSLLLWRRRRHTLRRLHAVVGGNGGVPLGQRVAALDDPALPTWPAA